MMSRLLVVASLLALVAAGCSGLGGQVPVGGDDDVTHVPDAGPGDVDAAPPGTPDAMPVPPADAAPDDYQPAVGPEVDGKLVINEFMAQNAYTLKDDTGAASDWVEIYNPGDVDVPLKGYSFTDDLASPRKAIITRDVTVKAHEHLVFYMDGTTDNGATHVAFQLSGDAAALGLARPDGSYIDRVAYGKQETDFSAAREPDGSDAWKIEWHPTPGGANPAGGGHPVGVEDPGQPPEAVPEAGDLSEKIMGYDQLPQFGLTVKPEDVQKLLTAPLEYVPALIVYDGRSYGPVGLRLKGSNSFEPFDHKPSLRISFDKYNSKARFFGMKDLTLDNMHSDYSMVHERLAYWVARQAGVPASRANHARLTVNGQFYGLYANVETIKKQMIERWFSDASGALFEGTDVDFEPQYVSLFELESGPDDRSLITGAANALANPDADAAIAAASQFVDMDSFLRFWATCAVIAQFDSFPYSNPGDDFHVYANPATHKLEFIPWGMDETFYSADFDVRQIHSVLAQKCSASSSCYQRFVTELWAVQKLTEDVNLGAERTRVINQIAPFVSMDQRKPYTDADVAMYQQNLFWFISERRMTLAGYVPPPSNN